VSRGKDETKGWSHNVEATLLSIGVATAPINRFRCTNKFIRNRLRAKAPGQSISIRAQAQALTTGAVNPPIPFGAPWPVDPVNVSRKLLRAFEVS